MNILKILQFSKLQPPELICFNHLYSEYRSMKTAVTDPEALRFIDELARKVENEVTEDAETPENRESRKKAPKAKLFNPSWDELYYFELVLADAIPVEKLRSKIIRIRSDYQRVVSQGDYNEYLSSKPPDLQSPPEPTDPPHATQAQYEKLLREDLKDLLGRIYMIYAVLPIREKRLSDLTWFAAKLCLIALTVLLGALFIGYVLPLAFAVWTGDRSLYEAFNDASSLTVFAVVLIGALGGFVSALQRIQSPPTEGDSIYNLSLLFYGSKSIFVAPVTGAIFATLLYFMFVAGLVQGSFLPEMYTPEGAIVRVSESSSSLERRRGPRMPPADQESNSASSNSFSNNASNSNSNSDVQANGNTNLSKAKFANSNIRIVDEREPEAKVALNALSIFRFIGQSGPVRGKDFALLIFWCFIAGFAERFVPDALDRIISNSKSAGK